MLYMVVEKFHTGKVKYIYERLDKKGRQMPDGLHYINSWIDEKLETCYQVMETGDVQKLNIWISNWNDLMDFEIVPVLTSAQARAKTFETPA